MHRATYLGMALLLMALAACGGSSGDDAPTSAPIADRPITTPATLSGTYFFASLSHREEGAQSSIADTGIFVADGAGNMTVTAHFRNDNGAVGGPLVREMRYDLAGDGSIGFRIGDNRVWTGGVASDGRWVVAASVVSDVQPLIMIAMRKSESRAEGFSASYHMGAYAARAFSPSCAYWGTHTFTGNGAMSVSNLYHNVFGAPAVSGPDGSGGGTYSIGEGGDITLGMFPGYTLLGGRSHEEVVIAGGDIESPIDPMIYVAVPITSGANAATFRGDYWSISTTTLVAPPPGTALSRVSLSSVTVDGAGALNYEAILENLEGEVNANGGSDTYAVADDGTLTLGGGIARGGITRSGSFGFVAGDLRDGQVPFFRVFIRK